MDLVFLEFCSIFAVVQQIMNGNAQLHWNFLLVLPSHNSGCGIDFIILV